MENFTIRVTNKLKEEKRSLHIYSSAGNEESFIHWPKKDEESRSEIFEMPSSCCSEENYLIITVPPRHNEDGEDRVACQVFLPSKSELNFISGDVIITPPHNGNGEPMSIEEGPPTWKLKVTRPQECCASRQEPDDDVTVGDNGKG
jgi:hypothetical protein